MRHTSEWPEPWRTIGFAVVALAAAALVWLTH